MSNDYWHHENIKEVIKPMQLTFEWTALSTPSMFVEEIEEVWTRIDRLKGDAKDEGVLVKADLVRAFTKRLVKDIPHIGLYHLEFASVHSTDMDQA